MRKSILMALAAMGLLAIGGAANALPVSGAGGIVAPSEQSELITEARHRSWHMNRGRHMGWRAQNRGRHMGWNRGRGNMGMYRERGQSQDMRRMRDRY